MPSADRSAEHVLSQTMDPVSKKLSLFERVRGVCQSVSIPIPGVVVVGEQSAGKSSLLESISGIQFPRAQNTCTRMPCVVSLLTDRSVKQPYAIVSMDPAFSEAEKCTLQQAIYVRVTRAEGPQMSLIDLPGITHNSTKMANIHQVTRELVEQYIAPTEMVILCVIPAANDFGNAEVLKLASKFDPSGERTLGVVTKCDDDAKREASDLVDKVMMKRDLDVKLDLGFHCVVSGSPKDIKEATSREDLRRLMEKIAKLQEARVDAHLPNILDKVRKKMMELEESLRRLPPAPHEPSQSRQFHQILSKIRKDLESRKKGESFDKALPITSVVDSKIKTFKKKLHSQNPKWLEADKIVEVSHLQDSKRGYTVDNMTGPNSHIFIGIIKKTFIEDGLLKEHTHAMIENIGGHLRNVVRHVIQQHASINGMLPHVMDATAQDCIDKAAEEVLATCDRLVEAQEVTSTENDNYMTTMTTFQDGLNPLLQEAQAEELEKKCESLVGALPGVKKADPKFVQLIKQARKDPRNVAVIQICASLDAYTFLMLESFVEMSAKLVKSSMVEKLADKLEEIWIEELGGDRLKELFAEDENATADVKPSRVATEKASAPAAGITKWNFAKSKEGATLKKGECIRSPKFNLAGMEDLELVLYPMGDEEASEGQMSLYLESPPAWQIKYKATLGKAERVSDEMQTSRSGWPNFASKDENATEIVVELMEAIHSKPTAST
ncbi:DRP4C [Symbiodinium sp. CCMP2592]|nr:DRP4C [Symbiodinium sp. CCMP2592]